MDNIAKYLYISLFLLICTQLEGQGVLFKGQNYEIDQRSSLEIVDNLHRNVQGKLEIAFKYRCYPDYRTGFIMNMKTGDSSPVINLFYDGVSENHFFVVIWEGHRYVTELSFPKQNGESPWLDVSLSLNPPADSLTLSIGEPYNISSTGWIDLPDAIKPDIAFGKRGHIIGIPSFGMKDLAIRTDDHSVGFDLKENSGNLAKSSTLFAHAKARNIIWLSNDFNHWKKVASFSSRSFICPGYDRIRHIAYAFDRDSMRVYRIDENSIERTKFNGRCPVEISLGTSFSEPSSGDLFAYEFYYSPEHAGRPCTFARLDMSDGTWHELSNDQGDLQIHHHCEYIDTTGRRLLVFGGFGNRRFNGSFYEIGWDGETWDKLPDFEGDKIEPRYFAAMGKDEDNGLLYIFGGLGNEIGDQIVGRQYMYNLYSVDLENGVSRLIWNTEWKEKDNCIVARNMIVPGDGWFYVLAYPESLTNSQIQLYRFRISDGKYEALGDLIPINSDKITTNANLYYDKEKEIAVAMIEESPDDIRSSVQVYTLKFPPTKTGISTTVLRTRRMAIWISCILLALLTSGTVTFVRIRKKKLSMKTAGDEKDEFDENRPNSIHVFGGFRAIDRNGEDITSLFTGKVLQLFCVILRADRNGGASSKRITSKLWPERDVDTAKNIRGVTISKLRKILERIDGLSLEFNDGKFKFNITEECYCDYIEFFNILKSRKQDTDQLIKLIHRGKVLSGETDEAFDRFKSEVEEIISKTITAEMVKRYENRQYMYSIECADILFEQDNLDEEALEYLIKSFIALKDEETARMRYLDFTTHYKKDYNEPYQKSFEELANAKNESKQ